MATAAARVSLLLILAVLSALLTPSHSQTCATQNLTGGRTYANCSELPVLGALLHYTYNASNSSLSVAYTAVPASGGAWVSWAINPTANGMVGSQALMALKLSNGSVVAKTYNISGYSSNSVVESELAFDVWDLSAEASSNGSMTVFASVKVPANASSVNQVWQVGGAVNGSQPSIHPMTTANMQSKSVLTLATSSAQSPALAPSAPAPSAAVRTFRPTGLGLGLVFGLGLSIASIIVS